MATMYNSHGHWMPLIEHYKAERERGNPTFTGKKELVRQHLHCPAIWGTPSLAKAVYYAVGSAAFTMNDEQVTQAFPEEVEEILSRPINTDSLLILADDPDGGYLLVDTRHKKYEKLSVESAEFVPKI